LELELLYSSSRLTEHSNRALNVVSFNWLFS